MPHSRIIFHLDMDAFFASIEIARNPSLKGKPVIIGGQPNQRGVVSTCSYEARRYGVRSAMSLKEAYRRCPKGVFLDGNYSLYRTISEKIMDILRLITYKVEVVSIDEAYLDVTDEVELFGSSQSLAQFIKNAIFKKTGLTCSVGIATNKLIAKIASGFAKPAKLCEIPPGEEKAFLAPLPIQTIPGIGPKTEAILKEDQIKIIEDLQKMSLDALMQKYGARGHYFYFAALGIDERPVDWLGQLPKSIGAETTFEVDQTDREVIVKALVELVEKACRHLKVQKMYTGAITLKLRDSGFTTITCSRMLQSDTQDPQVIRKEAVMLFEQNYDGLPLRLIGISLRKLNDRYWQPTFFDLEMS